MKKIKNYFMQVFYKKSMIFITFCSLLSIGFISADAINYKNMSLEERCIINWLALSGMKSSILDKKYNFDDIDTDLYPTLSLFVKKHRCPAELEKQIISQLSMKDVLSCKVQGLPHVMIKGTSFDRLVNADRMRRCIEINNLDRLMVPQKYMYKNGNDWGVAVLKVATSDRPMKFTLNDIKQLFILSIETGYRDWKFDCFHAEYRNFFYDTQGMIVCVDTEDLSYKVDGYGTQYLPFDCKANYVSSLLCYKDNMDEDAFNWLSEKVKELLKSPDAFMEYLSLPYNTQYDDPTINIHQAKNEYCAFVQAGYNHSLHDCQYQAVAA